MSLIEEFMKQRVKTGKEVYIFLLSGVRLDGVITAMDEESLYLTRKEVTQLVFRQALATVLPVGE